MEWVKTTAKTLPEAIDLALDNLGVDESEAEIVVLEEPKPGLFGRMRGTARVEARVKPKPIRPKAERNRGRRKGGETRGRKRSGRKGSEGNRGDGRSESGRSRSDGRGGRASGNRDGGGIRDGGGRSAARGDDGGRSDGGRGDGGARTDGGGRSRNRTRGRSGEQAAVGKDSAAGNGGRSERHERSRDRGGSGKGRDRSVDGGQETMPNEGAAVEDVAAHLRTFLTELTEAFGFDSDVTVDDSEDDVLVGRIEGRHGLLVGPKGRTLDAVQELARISCQRTVPSSVRIRVDVGGYRQQRAAALAGFAEKAAEKAVAEQLEVALEPMSPADRKAVHDALNGDPRVETRSVGSEPRRKVLVVPLVDEADDIYEDDDDDEDVEPVESVEGVEGVEAEAEAAEPVEDETVDDEDDEDEDDIAEADAGESTDDEEE